MTARLTPAELAGLPLYKVEELALTDIDALADIARRHTERLTLGTSPAHTTRVVNAYAGGFAAASAGRSERDNPFGHRNNFAAPQRRAWRWGFQKRLELGRVVAV